MKPSAFEIVIAIAVVAFLIWIANWDPLGSRARLKARAASAESQAVVSGATAKAVDQVATKTQAVQERTYVVIQRIKAAPGADAPIPAGVLAEWSRGLSDGSDDPPH